MADLLCSRPKKGSRHAPIAGIARHRNVANTEKTRAARSAGVLRGSSRAIAGAGARIAAGDRTPKKAQAYCAADAAQ